MSEIHLFESVTNAGRGKLQQLLYLYLQMRLYRQRIYIFTKLNVFYYVPFAIHTAEALSQWEWALHGSLTPEGCSLQTFYPHAIQA